MKNLIIVVVLIIVLATLSVLPPFEKVGSQFITALASLAAAGGLVALFFQFKRERDLNEADFVLRINHNFMTNESINKIYKLLEESKNDEQSKNPFTENNIIDMANYLCYFDPFYHLLKQGLTKFKCIDPIIAYRFFLATNNKYMQQMLLCKEGKEIAWENIYLLYELWTKYRKDNNRKIWQDNHALSKNKAYNKIVVN